MLLHDFAWYHAVLAAMVAALLAVLLARAVWNWKHGRTLWCAATATVAVLAAIVLVANVSNATNPMAGLLGA